MRLLCVAATVLCASCSSVQSIHRDRQPGSTFKPSVLMVAAEQTGVFNTGGLGHTVAGLAGALQNAGHPTHVVMPYYSSLDENPDLKIVREGDIHYEFMWGHIERPQLRFDLYSTTNRQNGVKTFLLKEVSGRGLFDNRRTGTEVAQRYATQELEAESFAAFSKAVAIFVSKRSQYDIINTHDWHAGLVGHYLDESIYLSQEYSIKKRVIFTISNAGYQGLVDREKVGAGRPWDAHYFRPDGYEFYGQFNFLKAGVRDADAVLTVAPSYARDLFTERFGFGLSGYFAEAASQKPFTAILNGVDLGGWTPPFLRGEYSKKLQLKLAVQQKYGLTVDASAPLMIMTSRLADQKGIRYWPLALQQSLMRHPKMQLLVVADGEAWVVEKLNQMSASFAGRMVRRPFDQEVEREITFAADFFVSLPWYEPSGTNQLFAMGSGTVPVLTKVGGLQDYVQDGRNGILVDVAFKGAGPEVDLEQTRASIVAGLDRVNACYADSRCFTALRDAAMSSDNSWGQSIERYEQLFKTVQDRPFRKRLPAGSCLKATDLLLAL